MSLLALPLLAATTLIIAGVTQATSPGPLIYRRRSLNAAGQTVYLFRFRTRHVRQTTPAPLARTRTVPYFPGGRFLETTGLVRLPEALNLWNGEHSWFGKPSQTLNLPAAAPLLIPELGINERVQPVVIRGANAAGNQLAPKS